MCLRCFPLDGGDLQNSLKGKRMMISGSTGATVYNKAGVGVRWMESTRWLAALFFLIIMFAGIYVYSKNSKAIVTLGIPISLVVFVGIIYWVKAMGDKADAYSKRALDARGGLWPKKMLATCRTGNLDPDHRSRNDPVDWFQSFRVESARTVNSVQTNRSCG